MAASNPYTSFTITQPFLGAPLQFQPALGSKELEELIDIYVIGTATKQDKLSNVTIDFYNNATVDLNTGALVRKYDVFPSTSTWAGQSFEQSPTQSQSSGFSPPIFTPSPGSSATFGDSGYGSISLTPPNRNRASKKPRKETKKDAEVRLPGFSIMTKDGVDVTSTAGRGTKTKEQREHAHLMRIMKACADCKRKKIRCDPSHRRSHNDMSRTSTSTTKTSSSGYQNPSPTNTAPSLSRQTTYDSPGNMPSFNSSNAMDDFVLFPEDSNSSFWDPADMSFPELESQDLSQFNFDINDIDLTDFPSTSANQSFDFSFHQQPSSFQSGNQTPYTPLLEDQYGLDEWAEPQGYNPVSHSRPHPSSSTRDAGQLLSNYQSSWLIADDTGISPRTSTFADNYWPDGSVQNPQIPQGVANESPMLSATSDWSILENSLEGERYSPPQSQNSLGLEPSTAEVKKRQFSSRQVGARHKPESDGIDDGPVAAESAGVDTSRYDRLLSRSDESTSSDLNIYTSGHAGFLPQSDGSVAVTSRAQSSRKRPATEELVRSQSTGGLSPVIQSSNPSVLVDPSDTRPSSDPCGCFSPANVSSSGDGQHGSDVLLGIGLNEQLLESQDFVNTTHPVVRGRGSRRRCQQKNITGSGSGSAVNATKAQSEPAAGTRPARRGIATIPDAQPAPGPRFSHASAPRGPANVSQDVHKLVNLCASLSRSLRAIPSAPVECSALASELQQLRSVLGQLQVRTTEEDIPESVLEAVKALALQLQVLSSHVWQLLHSGRPAHQSQEPAEPMFRQEFYRECQAQARRLLRSLCATINTIQARNSETSPSPATGNTQILTSRHNLQLFVPSSETQNLLQDYERHRRSRLSGAQILVDSAMSWEFSRASSGAAVDATSTTLLGEKSRAQLLNIVPDVDGVRVTSEKSQVGIQQVVATKPGIPQFSSILIKAEQTDLNRPYLESVDVERSATDLFEIALTSEMASPENDEMHVDHPLTPPSGEQRMPPLELFTPTPNPFTPLHRTWSAERGEVTLPSTHVQETSPSSVVQVAPFDHNHQTSSSLPSASNSSIHYSIAIAVALLSFSILFSTSKTFSPLLLFVQHLRHSVVDDDIATIAKLFLTATIIASPNYFATLFQSANSFACLAMAKLSFFGGNSEYCSAGVGKDGTNSSEGTLPSKNFQGSLAYQLNLLSELSPVAVVGYVGKKTL